MGIQDCLNSPEENSDNKVVSDMNISGKIMDIESDEDTFTLQVTDDSGLEDNLSDSFEINKNGILINVNSQTRSDSSGKQQKIKSVRILSDTYYDDDNDDDDDNCYDTDPEKLVQSKQAEVTDRIQYDCVKINEQAIENSQEATQNNCLENQNESIGNSGLEFSLRDFLENQGHHNESYNKELENSEIQDIECSNEHIDVDPKDNEDIDFTDKQWEYLPSALDGVQFEVGRNGANLEEQQALKDIQLLVNQKNSTQVENVNGEFGVGRIDASLEEQQALKDFESILNQEKDNNSTQDENVSREFEVRSDVNFEKQQALEDLELIMNQEKKQNSTQVGNFDHEPVETNFNSKNQQAVENMDSLINQKAKQDCEKIKNTNRELEEGEIEDNEIEMDRDSARKQREKSAELIVVPDKVNDRLFDNISDNFSDVSTVDNSYYEDFEYTTLDRNPSPPDDGEFSTFEDDDPWDYVEASLSDDCVIVDEIECLHKVVQSHTVSEENFSECSRRDQSDEEIIERYNNNNNNNERSKSRKRKSSTSSNHDSVEEVNVGNKNVDPDYDDFTGICSKEEVSELPDEDESISKKRKSHHGRDEDHPLFRDVDAEFCEKLMRVKKQGEIIVRPSSKGSDYLKITWKVTDGICQHVKVKKKLKSRSSGRYKYWINNKEFRSLDDIINSFITPMAQNALKLLEYKHFKQGINGIKATAEELLRAEKNKNPNCIPYIISAVKKSPGKFLISYLPRVTCYHEYIKVVAEGFRFRDQPFDNLIDLLIYFKANSKEVKPIALKDETVTSTTISRPGTPRPPTTKIHDLTPSILEVIQDLPDEKLESMRQILDSLAQSASNPPAFNQNRTPPFMFNGYHHQPFPPVPFPFPSYQQTFRPVVLGLPPANNVPLPVPYPENLDLPVPYPENLDLPVPNYNQPSTSRVTNLPLPPGT